MAPQQVSAWRQQLPPPFDKPVPIVRRRTSFGDGHAPDHSERKRRNSLHGAVEGSDRAVSWLRCVNKGDNVRRAKAIGLAKQKLKAYASSAQEWMEGVRTSKSLDLEPPSLQELALLASECFPRLEDVTTTITEFSERTHHVSRFTLEEVLSSRYLLDHPSFFAKVRWIHVDYHKLGTFWGSSVRFLQWGTDPALFEKSPIILMQNRSRELDRLVGRPPLEDEDIPEYKKIGRYYRQLPGSPEYLGIRTGSHAWIREEGCQLLLSYLEENPAIRRILEARCDNDLAYGLSYVRARAVLKAEDAKNNIFPMQVQRILSEEQVSFSGHWDDHVERLEFHREHTLLTCGSPRLYDVAAGRLRSKRDPLRTNPDGAYLYYVLARVSIENDEMMQDGPERDLNKIFAELKCKRRTDRSYVEGMYSLQQRVLDGLEYLEENRRELAIWGIPPLNNHHTEFHPDHTPPRELCNLIAHEMSLVDKDFQQTIGHWTALKCKVDRYLDLVMSFRVLEQQELATQQGVLAVKEAQTSRAQSRSVMIFTFITIVFLPLSFLASYFSMDVAAIIHRPEESKVFWLISAPVTGAIIMAVWLVTRQFGKGVGEADIEAGKYARQKQEGWFERWLVKRKKIKGI